MDKEQLERLNNDEVLLIEKLNKIFDYDEVESDIIINKYTGIKFSGFANLRDILQFEALGIPIYELIAALREKTTSTVIDDLNQRSTNFYEIRKALDMFVASSWNP
jgi:hypothetical protein